MRTNKSTLCLVICLLYLCCFVQQCHLFAFGLLSGMVSNAIGTAITMSSSMFINAVQTSLHGIMSAIFHGFSSIHTMTMSLVSGFLLGNLALAGFILFLLAVVPAEEEKRSLGGQFVFTPRIPFHNYTNHRGIPFIPYHNLTDHRGVPILLSPSPTNSSLVRNKRDILVNNNATITTNAGENFTLPTFVEESNSTERIPRFLTRLVQRDPLNCLPLLLCGLSASRKPSERTETLNDYAYLLKEVLKPDSEESAEDDVSDEYDGKKKNERLRSPIALLNQLVQGGLTGKKKDEVDKMIERMRNEQDAKLEEIALTEMAEDPNDLRFALEDMKVKGLKHTMSKLPQASKSKYITKLLGDESAEDEEADMIPDEEDPLVQKALLGRYDRPQYPDESTSMEEPHQHFRRPYPMFYDTRELTRGAFPPPPPTPPTPEYGVSEDELYKRNYAALQESLEHEVPPGFMRRKIVSANMGRRTNRPPHKGHGSRRSRRNVRHAAPQRAFLQKKRGEAAEADNIYDKARIAAEVGAVTRNNRQCRTLFSECPVSTIARPVAAAAADSVGGAPFLNRAVNNIRRVILGTSPGGESAKTKRVNEIKEAIQQLHPATNHGASEVKVVLNIGPSGQPQFDVHRSGGAPVANLYQNQQTMQNSQMNYPQQSSMSSSQNQPTMPSPTPTGFSTNLKHIISTKQILRTTERLPATTPKSASGTTKKSMVYRNPASSPASKKPLPTVSTSPSVDLDDLEQLLKTTMPPNDEEITTTYPVFEDSTLPFNTFTDIAVASMEQDEPSVEDDLVLPTKYPMSKDQYAQNLRETFQIFNRFKEAHKTPVVVTIARSTVKPETTTVAATTGTRKQIATKVNNGNKPGSSSTTKENGSKKSTSSKKKFDGEKGEQADLEAEDESDEGGGDQNDLSSIIKWFQNFRKRKRPNKKGKGKKKKPDKSSEESSEEDYHDHHPLVAVPPPHLRQKIHWRAGTTVVKDAAYHLIFGKKVARPLPPIPGHYHHGESDEEDEHHGEKPIRHDYHGHPHHDIPQDDKLDDDDEEDDDEKGPTNENDNPGYYHRLRTSESVEEDIPPPPVSQDQREGAAQHDDNPEHNAASSSSSTSEPASSSGSKITSQKPIKSKAKPKTVVRPITRPDPEPSSYEDDNYEDDDYEHLPRPLPPPLPPRHLLHYDSRSIENSYEEEADDNDELTVKPTKPQLIYSPFSIIREGNKLKLKSGGKRAETIPNSKTGGKKNKKAKGTSAGALRGVVGTKANNAGSGSTSSKSFSKQNGGAYKGGSGSTKSKSKPSNSNLLMTKVKPMSTTTVQPKKKVLKYKNG